MKTRTIKTAVSLPADVYQQAEAIRKKLGKSRSGFVSEAIQAYFADKKEALLDAQYEAGYRNNPEKAVESAAWLKASASSWGPKEDW